MLEDHIGNEDGRRVYARLTGPQGANILTSMARANGLAICPEDTPVIEKGQRVQVRMLGWDEEGVY